MSAFFVLVCDWSAAFFDQSQTSLLCYPLCKDGASRVVFTSQWRNL